MQTETKLSRAATGIAEGVATLVLIAEDGRVDPDEFPLLLAAIDDLAEQGYRVEDANFDQLLAIQTIRLGRENVPDERHLGPRERQFAADRARFEERKEEAALRGNRRAASEG